ncbi:MAG: sugar-binding protein [Lentisphaeria bacterium]|nr:sugar-binding protein [Lentisphaeria bacterium]
MKRVKFFFVLVAALFFAAETAFAQHWFEAEDFKGNSHIVQSGDCSGGACVEGKTWYRLLADLPFPQDGESYNVWIRAKSDVAAQWYLQDVNDSKKTFGWFRTEQADEWTWILVGKFSPKVGKVFPYVHLQKPINTAIPSATGRIDAIVMSKSDDPAVPEKLLTARLAAAKPALDSALGTVEISELVASRRVADVPFSNTKPRIDGNLDDEIWQNATKLTDFSLSSGKMLASEQTLGYLAYDDENFYVAAELYESQIPFIRKIRSTRNDNVWTDDCLELFIDNAFTQKESLHFIVNAIGTKQDNLASRLDRVSAVGQEGLDWEAAARIHDDRWTVEIAIPLRLLDAKTPEQGEIWGFNMNREQNPKNEISHWNFVGGQFHQPDKFGLISFAQKAAALEKIMFVDFHKTLNFSFAAIEPDSEVKSLKVDLQVKKDSVPISHNSSHLVLKPGDRPTFNFPLLLDKPGSYELDALIQAGQQTIYKLKLPFKTYSDGLVSVAWPPEMRNNKLHIAESTAQHCFFLFANHYIDEKEIGDMQFEISVPEKVTVLDPRDSRMTSLGRYNQVKAWRQEPEMRHEQKYIRHIFSLERSIAPSRIEKVRFFQNSLMIFFKVKEGDFPASSELPVYYGLKAAELVEEENIFQLHVLPRPNGRQPKEILIYNWLWTFNENPYIWSPYLDTMQQVGFNAVSCSDSEAYYCLEAKKHNHKIINNLWWFWQNQAHLQRYPEDLSWTFDLQKSDGPNPIVCPSIMLTDNGKLLRESISRYSRACAEKLVDGYVWDLEHPGAWQLCFCPKCIAEFKEFAAIVSSKKLLPEDIREQYAQQWVLFATHQSSMTSKIIREELKRGNSQALFGVYSGMPSQMTMENYRCNWSELANYIDLAMPTGYSISATALGSNFTQGWKNFIRELSENTKDSGNQVKNIPTLTAGYERGQAVQPSAELNRMQILRSVASGCKGVAFWWWGTMDGRYYREIARATALIAEFEDFFLHGEVKNEVLKITGPEQGSRFSREVFKYGNKYLCVFFNHSETEALSLNFSPVGLPQTLKASFYPEMEPKQQSRDYTIEIAPLDTTVLLLQ